ncbi:MAG: hypothetical protein D6737_19510 [Chloroflexi bacterium]|nr:MAG: hypothetical protein D6737_19510 [Chloroflexota bacterium]
MAKHGFEGMYPDVLGAITDGIRVPMGDLQCAAGIFPHQTYLNQPVEAVVILQNMVDQNMQVKVGIQTPGKDKNGRPVRIELARKTITLGMQPGEVGVLRIPLLPMKPTPPAHGYPIRLAIRYRTGKSGNRVRTPAGGAPPSVLSISPFKLQALRDVAYEIHLWNESAEILTLYFDVAAKGVPGGTHNLQARYETLWSNEVIDEEIHLARQQVENAHLAMSSLTPMNTYQALYDEIDVRFNLREMALHPGEIAAITKIMVYTLDQAFILEPGYTVERSRWFRTLCQLLAHDEKLAQDPQTLAAVHLFEAALFDAIMLSFDLVNKRIKEDFGSIDEQINYGNRVVAWLAGQGQADLSYAYLPLVMGGLVTNSRIKNRLINPWDMIDDLGQAIRGRRRLVGGEKAFVLDIAERLHEHATQELEHLHIPRPES